MSNIKVNKLPLGLTEIFYEYWLKLAVVSLKFRLISQNKDFDDFMTIYMPILVVSNISFRLINMLVSLLLDNEMSLLCLSLIATILIIEKIKSDGNLNRIYENGHTSIIRNLVETHDDHIYDTTKTQI